MAGELPGRLDPFARGRFGIDLDWAWPQQPERSTGRCDDGRFEAAFGSSRVDDQGNPSPQLLIVFVAPRPLIGAPALVERRAKRRPGAAKHTQFCRGPGCTRPAHSRTRPQTV